MKAKRYFELVRELPICPWQQLTQGRPFVVVSPHPDDESLGAGGLIALACRQGQAAAVVLLTDGSGSHPNSLAYPRDRLIAMRRAEMEEAGRILGLAPDRLHALGLPDTAAPSSGPDFDAAAASIVEVIEKIQAHCLFVTWSGDPHCDHQAAAVLAAEVQRRMPSIELWAYPVWGWHLPPDAPVSAPAPRGCRVDIGDVRATKRAAIAAHLSQMTDLIQDDPAGFRFTDQTLAPFLGSYEYFIRISP